MCGMSVAISLEDCLALERFRTARKQMVAIPRLTVIRRIAMVL